MNGSSSRYPSAKNLASTGGMATDRRNSSRGKPIQSPIRPFIDELAAEKLLKENRKLRDEIIRMKEINVRYAQLLGSIVEIQHGEEANELSKDKRLKELNKNLLSVNSNIRQQLTVYRNREQQLEKLQSYLQNNKFKDLSEWIGKYEKQESVIQSQKHQMDSLNESIDELNRLLEDKSQISQLKKVIKKQQDQNQKLEAKCSKLVDELEKCTRLSNMQKAQSYQTEMQGLLGQGRKLREFERKDKQGRVGRQVSSLGAKENINNLDR